MCSASDFPRSSVLALFSLSSQSWQREPGVSECAGESKGRSKSRGALPVPYLNRRSIVRTSEITFISTTCDSWLMGGRKGHGPRFQARKELNPKAIARSIYSQTSFLSNQGAQLGNVAGLAQMCHRCGGGKQLTVHVLCVYNWR